MSNEQHRAVVARMWNTLTAMDWETLKSCLTDDVHYEDVPTEDPGAHTRYSQLATRNSQLATR